MNVFGLVLAREAVESRDFVVHGVAESETARNEKKKMIARAVSEMSKLFNMEDIYILADHAGALRDERKEGEKDILLPYVSVGSATMGYAAVYMMERYGDGILCVCASDAIPKRFDAIQSMISKGIKLATDRDKMIVLNTGVSSGMDGLLGAQPERLYIWKASVFLQTLRDVLPRTHVELEKIRECMEDDVDEAIIMDIYEATPTVSLDLGLFNKAINVVEYFIDVDEEKKEVHWAI